MSKLKLPKIDAGDQELSRVTEKAWKAIKANSPPTFVCTDMLASPIADMPLPILKGIQVSPVGGEQRDDHKRGYDPESEIYYVEEVSP